MSLALILFALLGHSAALASECPFPIMEPNFGDPSDEAVLTSLYKRRTAYTKTKVKDPAEKKVCLAEFDRSIQYWKDRVKTKKSLKGLSFREILRKELCFTPKSKNAAACPPAGRLKKNGEDVVFAKTVSFTKIGQKKEDVMDPDTECKVSQETEWTPAGVRNLEMSKCSGMGEDAAKDKVYEVEWIDGVLVYRKGELRCEYLAQPESDSCSS